MLLTKLRYANFRNLIDAEIEFSPAITVLKGRNAQGKTNILEAICLLALTKSFRGRQTLEAVRWGENYFRLEGLIDSTPLAIQDGQPHNPKTIRLMEVYYEREPLKRSRFAIDKLPLKAQDYVGEFRIVTFVPDDVEVLSGNPGQRRRYLDILLAQVDRDYLYAWSDYRQTLKSRNSLLARIANGKATRDELDFWDGKLVEFGRPLMAKRQATLDWFATRFPLFLEMIAGQSSAVKIKYQPSLPSDRDWREYLAGDQEGDIWQKATRKGPHRDNFSVLVAGRDLGQCGSRGEIRSALLAMKMCELQFMEEKGGQKPLLLLDDVFSELDTIRQKALLNMISPYQTLITSTDQFLGAAKDVLNIDKGTIY